MRKLACFMFMAVSGILPVFSQSSLDVDHIPDSLLAGSNAVTRYYTSMYERESTESYSLDIHYAVTVLNARGKHAAKLLVPYDRNSEVSDIRGTLYNGKGIILGRLKKKDIKDFPSNASYTLFSDNRVKTLSPSINNYPFTVEYSYRVEYDATVGFGNWMPVRWFDASTEKAELLVRTPGNLDIRYRAMNHSFDFSVDTSAEIRVYSWTAKQLKAIESEPNLPNYLDYMPVVMLAPNEISFEGTTGSYTTWNAYGKWVYSLIEDRDRLPEETVAGMRQLTDTIPDRRDKVKAIYQYMQGRTRYVNIALGIGGFQPLHAYEVDEKGYGDCKALSNYTRALLKSVGIASCYTEIGNGRSRELKYPDFASANQTNHVILCVPLDQDTVWLECTSQSIPFGYIGAGNSNRYALLINERGGVLARTPVYPAPENKRVSKSKLGIDASGNAAYEVITDFTNTEYEDIAGLLKLSKKEQRESLLRYFSLEGFVMNSFIINETTVSDPEARISLRGKVPKFASKSGSRLFLRPEYLFSQTDLRTISKDRIPDYYKPVGYHHIDTLSIQLPENFQTERLPEHVSIESRFGNYTLSMTQTGSEIRVVRELVIRSGKYEKSQFTTYNAFARAINKSDQTRIVIQKIP